MGWPETPKGSGMGTSSVANPSESIGRGHHHFNGKHKVITEDSSPASTYGETAIGDSVPATPNEPAGPSGEANLTGLDPILAQNPMERLWAKEAHFVKPSIQEIAQILGGPQGAASSSSSEGAWEPGSSVKRVASFESVNALVSPMASVDENLGYDSEGNSRNAFRKKHGISFVKGEASPNDPFICGDVTKKEMGSGESSSPPAVGGQATETPESVKFRPRGDRATQEISSDNAQAVLPPSSCVFIANLSNSLSDIELQRAVEKVFCEFGKVYVKIKRDARGMPFAFAQYENVECAERAIEEGRGLVINGRQCRTEQAKVNRSLYLTATNGKHITEAEARRLLEGYGDLEKVWHCTDTERQMYNLSPGIWVTFAFFQDARDAQNKFKESSSHHLENHDHSGRSARAASSMKGTPSPMFNAAGGRAVQVNGLPGTACPEHVRGLFDHLGKHCVAQIEMSSRVVQTNVAETSALITFRAQHLIDSVMESTAQYALGGHKLSLKVVNMRSTEIRGRQQGANYSGSPSYRRRAVSRAYQPSAARALPMAMHPDAFPASFDTNTGAMSYNGTCSNLGAYYPFNGFQAPYTSYGMPGPNDDPPPGHPTASSTNPGTTVLHAYGYPYYTLVHPGYFPPTNSAGIPLQGGPQNPMRDNDDYHEITIPTSRMPPM